MIALRLVRLIESHCDQLTEILIGKLLLDSRTSDMRKVPIVELRQRLHELLQHLSEWLLNKPNQDIEVQYRTLGARRAEQGVSLSDFAWAVVLTKEHLWEFLERQGFLRNAVEIYGEMELLRLLDQFFDRALCYVIEGYEMVRPATGLPVQSGYNQAGVN